MRLLNDAGLREKGITYSRQHRQRLIKKGLFPAPVKGAGPENKWPEPEIDQYVESLLTARDAVKVATA
jgi:prophage regulatory protein